ncbi:hypothetical protein ACFOET_14010 [Parapedobacter deserti]|uniref:DUF5007 domain-containing protein n=1 Tax=Parapedobacter deserti TaxID=1912957 RepID=A0ABV7JTV3_9SPHI
MKRLATAMVIAGCAALFAGCVDIPKEGSIAPDIGYRNRKQYAMSGLEQYIGDFLASTSSLPLHFEIMNIRETNGQDVSALSKQIPVVRYTKAITGGESEEELRLKTDTIALPAVTINQHTGVIEVLEGNHIPAGEYRFDIKVSNSSGSRVLQDALIIEFMEYEVISWSAGMARRPEIERVADAPNQIRFVGYLNGEALPGDRIDFTRSRSVGFRGTFVDDTDDGEIWDVDFPVMESNTYCSWKILGQTGEVSYMSENFNFVLGLPGSYVIRLYK